MVERGLGKKPWTNQLASHDFGCGAQFIASELNTGAGYYLPKVIFTGW
jgi:hypothetical protein